MSNFNVPSAPPVDFARQAYGAWRQTVDNARALAAAPRFTLPPPPPPTVLDAFGRAAWLAQQQSERASDPFRSEQTLGLASPGQVWPLIKRVVKVGFRFLGWVGDGLLIYDFSKAAYNWVPNQPGAPRPPALYSAETSMNYYLQMDGTYKPSGIKMQ